MGYYLQKNGISYIDFEFLRIYRRYVELKIFNNNDHKNAQEAIIKMDMSWLASILMKNIRNFEACINKVLCSENGQVIIKNATRSIFNNIQLKLSYIMEE